jgi:hypothetical protein
MPANVVTAGATLTGVGSATLPAQALVGSTANRLELVEIAIVNTTGVACVWNLVKISTAGTPGASLTSVPHDGADTATGVVKQAYTVTPTIGADFGYRIRVPATIGSGVIRPLNAGGTGLIIPATAAAGIGLVSAAGQICDIDWTWIEL